VASILLEGGTVCAHLGVLERGWLLVDGAQIREVGAYPAPSVDAHILPLGGRTVTPGLIDLHVHGALGYDTMDASPESLREMARFCVRHGVTAFLATTMAASTERILAALEAVKETAHTDTGGARLLGAHVESPYIAKARAGAQDARHVHLPAPQECASILATDVVRILTLAPELPRSEDVIGAALEAGAVPSIGHTQATYEQVRRAVELGVRHVTHLFNGMEPLHHRRPGALGAALTMDALTCELIADNVHVHPAVLDLALRAKGVERIALVTDAMRGVGMPDGDYELGGQRVLVRDGVARLPGGALAGSTLTLDRAVHNAMAAAGLPFCQAVRMASEIPARVLGLHTRTGAIAPGLDADLAVWDQAGRIVLTIVQGRIVYDAG